MPWYQFVLLIFILLIAVAYYMRRAVREIDEKLDAVLGELGIDPKRQVQFWMLLKGLSSDPKASLEVTNRLTTIGQIQGFLQAFAIVNGKVNHGYYFTFEHLVGYRTIEEFQDSYKDDPHFTVQLLTDWQPELCTTLLRWLLEFLNSSDDVLTDKKHAFSISGDMGRQEITDEFLAKITSLGEPDAVWKIDWSYWECYAEGFIFSINGELYRLALSWSD